MEFAVILEGRVESIISIGFSIQSIEICLTFDNIMENDDLKSSPLASLIILTHPTEHHTSFQGLTEIN